MQLQASSPHLVVGELLGFAQDGRRVGRLVVADSVSFHHHHHHHREWLRCAGLHKAAPSPYDPAVQVRSSYEGTAVTYDTFSALWRHPPEGTDALIPWRSYR